MQVWPGAAARAEEAVEERDDCLHHTPPEEEEDGDDEDAVEDLTQLEAGGQLLVQDRDGEIRLPYDAIVRANLIGLMKPAL